MRAVLKNVQIPVEIHARLSEHSKTTGISMSHTMRTLLNKFLDEYEAERKFSVGLFELEVKEKGKYDE